MHDEKYPLIQHPSDPRFRLLRSLQTPQGRSQSGQFLVEGIRHVSQALNGNARIQLLFVDPSVLSNPFGQKLARRIRQSGVPAVRLAPQLYRDLTLASEPQGIGAVVQQRWFSFADILPGRNSLWLALESIEQPGNLGTILRTAEAAGVTGVFLLGSGADPLVPAAVRATMGSIFSLKLVRGSVREFVSWTECHGVSIVGSSPRGLMSYKAIRYRWPVVLAMGSEKEGLSPQLIESASFMVRIPMKFSADSINVAVAAGVLLFEISSQAGKMASAPPGRLWPSRG